MKCLMNDMLNSNAGSSKGRSFGKKSGQDKDFSDVRDRVQSMKTKSYATHLAHSGEEYVSKTTGNNLLSDSISPVKNKH